MNKSAYNKVTTINQVDLCIYQELVSTLVLFQSVSLVLFQLVSLVLFQLVSLVLFQLLSLVLFIVPSLIATCIEYVAGSLIQ